MAAHQYNEDRESLYYLIGASIITVAIWFLPFAWMLVYPLRLFVTYIHEGGHALATILTLGSVRGMEIFTNAGGVTYTEGGIQIVISSAGYLSSTAYGAALLILARNRNNAKTALTLTAGIILALTFIFVQGLPSTIIGITLAAGLIFAAIVFPPRVAQFVLSFLAVQSCLNALFDLKTLLLISAVTNSHSDAVNMQNVTGIPAVIWAIFWIGLSLITLFIALNSYRRTALA